LNALSVFVEREVEMAELAFKSTQSLCQWLYLGAVHWPTFKVERNLNKKRKINPKNKGIRQAYSNTSLP